MSEREDAALQAALRASLAARDRSAPAQPFAAMCVDATRPHPTLPRLRGRARDGAGWVGAIGAALASAAAIALLWIGLRDHRAGIDERLAQQLSSPAYWRVPTDELLVFQAPPLSAELPAADPSQISLEDSFL